MSRRSILRGCIALAGAALLGLVVAVPRLARAVDASAAPEDIAIVRVDATPGHALNRFDPDSALGSSIDVLSRPGIEKLYTPHIVQEALSASWGPITYRNNSELRMAAWHWTEHGTWSDPVHQSGYFTGSSELHEPIGHILSYGLPHRGQSWSDDRPIQSASPSYWKSNPYLTSTFTSERDSLHPQWMVIDLGAVAPVNAVRIAWDSPYARTYEVAYWVGRAPMDRAPAGAWRVFPAGTVRHGAGGTVTLKLAPSPVSARYVRIWMTESSNTCDQHGPGDIRNCVGYAIQSVSAGRIERSGAFVEAVIEPAGSSGTAAARPPSTSDSDTRARRGVTILTSSIDPWHSAQDVSATGSYEHTGFDLFFESGLTNGLPAMIPVTLLYGTPEDAAAQIAYLEKRAYPIGWVEMGEEPDGKHMLPEDYAALYLQWAAALHKVDPALKLGGPVFEGINEDIKVWPDVQGRTSWTGRFIEYLRAHGRLSDLSFWSFEHYPLRACAITWKDLYREPQLMRHIVQAFRENGLPGNIPVMVTESHLSPRLTGPMSTIFAALWLADSVGAFFEAGGAAYYHSPIQPQPVSNSCLGWATWSNFVADRDDTITGYTAPYFAARLINLEWVQHRSGTHVLVPSSASAQDAEGHLLITTYAVHRPDDNWSLMLVNRDETHPHAVRVVLEDLETGRLGFFSGAVTQVTFGSEQYVWKEDGPRSHADPDGPPATRLLTGGPEATFTLPMASVTVLRGKVRF